jgi:hypothetical protein
MEFFEAVLLLQQQLSATTTVAVWHSNETPASR